MLAMNTDEKGSYQVLQPADEDNEVAVGDLVVYKEFTSCQVLKIYEDGSTDIKLPGGVIEKADRSQIRSKGFEQKAPSDPSVAPLLEDQGLGAAVGTSRSSSRDVLRREPGEPSEVSPRTAAQETLLATGEQIDLEEDVYSAAIFTLIFDTFEFSTGRHDRGVTKRISIYRMTLVILSLAANYILQFSLLYWIYRFVALPAKHTVQELYREFHAEVFNDGAVDEDLWSHWGAAKHDEVCSVAFVSFDFMYALLIIWWVNMVIELRKTERLMRKFKSIKKCDLAKDMVLKDEEDTILVVQLTSRVQALLWATLLIPKFVIAIALTIVGTVWLAATDSYSDLILNALALQFVVQVDELLFKGLLPESIRSDIASTKLVIPKKETSDDVFVAAKDDEDQVLSGFRRSTIYTASLILVVFAFMTVGQDIPYLGVFPGNKVEDIKNACPTWYQRNAVAICRFGKECFPVIGNSHWDGHGHAPSGFYRHGYLGGGGEGRGGKGR